MTNVLVNRVKFVNKVQVTMPVDKIPQFKMEVNESSNESYRKGKKPLV